MTLYNIDVFDKILEKYVKNGKDFDMITIDGSLLDNYIIHGHGLKTAIIKETYLNECSSAYSIRFYNNTPKKYDEIIKLWQDEQYEKAKQLFFKR